MKMFKKLMAVVLTGALAVSMLTGCALGDAAASKALEKALNAKGTQGTVTVDYNHKSGLDDKAEKIWKDTDKMNKTAPTSLSAFDTKEYTFGNNSKYIAYVAEQPEDSKSAKASWMTEAEKLHKAVTDKKVDKTAAGQIHTDSKADATKKDVDFGTAFVSKTEGGKTTKYVIVVFKVNG